jgi:hypothetical protein
MPALFQFYGTIITHISGDTRAGPAWNFSLISGLFRINSVEKRGFLPILKMEERFRGHGF